MRQECQCRSKLSFVLPYGSLPINRYLESSVMGVSKRQTVKNKQAIITAAERLFRERGVDGVGLNELMREAGFTQGGFYNHFESKDSLVAEVVATAVTSANARLCEQIGKPLEAYNPNRFARQIKNYLTANNRDDMEKSCAIACLAPDARRMSQAAQTAYAQGVHAALGQLSSIIASDPMLRAAQESPRDRAIALYAQMVGALVLSRAVMSADRMLSDEILSAARVDLLQAVGDETGGISVPARQARSKTSSNRKVYGGRVAADGG
jgi:TetR/AcrR family transcriptional regulator, transcriptional repressor for nem operon